MQGGAEGSFFRNIQQGAGIDLSFDTPGELVGNMLPYVFGLAGITLLIYLILGGFQLMTSRGDPKAIQAAQGKITNAVIGFVIIIIAYFLVNLLGQIFNIEQFGPIFGK
ncbi:MAG TPA: hypothetical protein VJ227_01770 [Patescibacteria group bacterium]|nr:hypothetical protein [Patescibacteria group bacterium]